MNSGTFFHSSWVVAIDTLIQDKNLQNYHIITKSLWKTLDSISENEIKISNFQLQKLFDLHTINNVSCSTFAKNVLLWHLQQNRTETIELIIKNIDKIPGGYLKAFSLYITSYVFKVIDEQILASLTTYQIKNLCIIIDFFADSLNSYIAHKFIHNTSPNYSKIPWLYKESKKNRDFSFSLDLLKKYKQEVGEKNWKLEALKVYANMKNYGQLWEEIESYLKEQPYDYHAWSLWVDTLIKSKNLCQAELILKEYFHALSDKQKEDHRAWRYASILEYYNGNIKQALSKIYKSLSINSKDVLLHEFKAKLLTMMGFDSKALDAAEHAYSLKQSENNFDLMMFHLERLKTHQSSNMSIAVFIDITDCNADELISYSERAFKNYGDSNNLFTISKLYFITKKEPKYFFTNLTIPYQICTIKNVVDEILFGSVDFHSISSEWISFISGNRIAEFITSVESLSRPGLREGLVLFDHFHLIRTKVVKDFLPFYLINFLNNKKISTFIEEIKARFFIKGKERPQNISGKVLFLTPRGFANFGGAEEFFRSISDAIVKQYGFDVEIIGFGIEDLPLQNHYYPGHDIKKIKEIIYKMNPDMIWAATIDTMQTIYQSLQYIRGLSVIGLHYYRAIFLSEITNEFLNINGTIPRHSFSQALTSADITYCNSVFLQRLIRDKFNVSLPILYSLPHKIPLGVSNLADRKYVLMVNTSMQKGFDLFMDIAEKMQDTPFLALSNQSSHEDAEAACKARGLTNVTIQPFQEDMLTVYKQAKVVLVPSYLIKETFSRVCIEAQSLGIPVIGSTIGNIPYLLQDSGIILDKDVSAWVRELNKLFIDTPYYVSRVNMAFENAKNRYSYSQQQKKLNNFRAYQRKRILVGMGSGIGNMVLASPVLKKLYEAYQAPIDIVLSGVPAGAITIFANSPYVNAVYYKTQIVQNRYYDIIFHTRSTSQEVTYAYFNAEKIYRTRDLFDYIDFRQLHESESELMALKHFLGIPYEAEDIYAYHACGNPFPKQPSPKRLGLHAGCKEGKWKIKRWPYFATLAEKMHLRGWEVVSIGTPDEYVEGTLDLTSFDTWEIMESISSCQYFVGNESGLSHLAKALGVAGTALLGPTYSKKVVPFGMGWKVLHSQAECAPCFFNSDFDQLTCTCMDRISVEDVIATIVEFDGRKTTDNELALNQGELMLFDV